MICPRLVVIFLSSELLSILSNGAWELGPEHEIREKHADHDQVDCSVFTACWGESCQFSYF